MKVSDLIKPLIFVGCVVFIICYLWEEPTSIDGYMTYISYSVSAATLLFIVYERWLWRFIPWKRPPVLKRRYDGKIFYVEKRESKEKHIEVYVKQSLFSVRIKTKTDINESYSVSASIEREHGNHFLYYTYTTNPNAIVQKSNPIQHGTCRMALHNDTQSVSGKYWTSSQTIGDITWNERKRKN